jgi:integration host factor subunit beta
MDNKANLDTTSAGSESFIKIDIANAISRKMGLKHGHSLEIVNLVLEEILGALKDGMRVRLRGFGCFYHKSYKARVGRNPRSPHTPIPIPECRGIKFKPGRRLREDSKNSLAVSIS